MTRPERSTIASWLRVVAITPGRWEVDATVAFADAVLDGGATAVLVRELQLEENSRAAAVMRIAERCRAHGAACLVSRDIEAARRAGADAVHTGWNGPTVAAIHAAGLVAGRSAHWPLEAEDHAADYVTLSPFAETHRSYARPRLTDDDVAAARAQLDGPICALGGLGLANIARLPDGLAGVAVIRALSDVPDPRGTAAQLRSLVDARLDFGGSGA